MPWIQGHWPHDEIKEDKESMALTLPSSHPVSSLGPDGWKMPEGSISCLCWCLSALAALTDT